MRKRCCHLFYAQFPNTNLPLHDPVEPGQALLPVVDHLHHGDSRCSTCCLLDGQHWTELSSRERQDDSSPDRGCTGPAGATGPRSRYHGGPAGQRGRWKQLIRFLPVGGCSTAGTAVLLSLFRSLSTSAGHLPQLGHLPVTATL